jgi:hypothetical protein
MPTTENGGVHMETEHHAQLTSAEISQIWASYQNDTLATCVLQYFLETVEDTEIGSVIQYGLELTNAHIQQLTAIYNEEDYPVPYGFTDKDVGQYMIRGKNIAAKHVDIFGSILRANILIDNGWMEQPPKAADRDELANK